MSAGDWWGNSIADCRMQISICNLHSAICNGELALILGLDAITYSFARSFTKR